MICQISTCPLCMDIFEDVSALDNHDCPGEAITFHQGRESGSEEFCLAVFDIFSTESPKNNSATRFFLIIKFVFDYYVSKKP